MREMIIKDYIEHYYKTPVSLRDLSEYMGLSKGYLSRIFKKTLGQNFLEYLYSVRLSHAQSDLIETDKAVSAIAADNGFPSTLIFNRYFKEQYHETPTAFRKRYQLPREKIQTGTDENILRNALIDLLDKQSVTSSANTFIIQFDAEKIVSAEYHNGWNMIMNIPDASQIQNCEVQKQILLLQRKLRFSYARLKGFFTPAMNVDLTTSQTKHNFYAIDTVLDFLTSNKILPYIVCPECPVEDGTLNSIISINYHSFMNQLLIHLTERYGKEQLVQWRFELSVNDPDYSLENHISFFAEYNSLIKQFGELIQIGGPGLLLQEENHRDLEELFKLYRTKYIFPDFLCIKLFQSKFLVKNEIAVEEIRNDTRYIQRELRFVRSLQRKYNIGNLPLIVSEWNEIQSNYNVLNDSCNRGAYILKTLLENTGNADAISYNSAMDIFFEGLHTNDFLNGTMGLLNKWGVQKPAFFALEFLKFAGKYIITQGDNYFVTKSGDDHFQVFIYNYKKYRKDFYITGKQNFVMPSNLNSIIQDTDYTRADIYISGLRSGEYRIQQLLINEDSGSVMNLWKKLGYVSNPTVGEVEYLSGMCQPTGGIYQYSLVTSGVLHLDFLIKPFEISITNIQHV